MARTPACDRAQALANLLECLTEDDLCVLCDITPNTAENWRKRGKGPAYALAGNRYLYPRHAVVEFLEQQLRERNAAPTRGQL